jgi:hypothetical protein
MLDGELTTSSSIITLPFDSAKHGLKNDVTREANYHSEYY